MTSERPTKTIVPKRAVLVAMMLLSLFPPRASAGALLRVISHDAPIHVGPGSHYRSLHTVNRGNILEVVERAKEGYWFKIRLNDGTTGWIYGELVFPFEGVSTNSEGLLSRMGGAISDTLLGPSPVHSSNVEISFSAGILDREGIFLLRPAWLIDPYFALEGFVGLSPRQQEDLFLTGMGWTLRLVPGAAIGPYLHSGVGLARIRPKADNFTQQGDTLFSLVAGGGFEITFKKKITLRLDFRNWTIVDPDQASNRQEYSGGLAIFF